MVHPLGKWERKKLNNINQKFHNQWNKNTLLPEIKYSQRLNKGLTSKFPDSNSDQPPDEV